MHDSLIDVYQYSNPDSSKSLLFGNTGKPMNFKTKSGTIEAYKDMQFQ